MRPRVASWTTSSFVSFASSEQKQNRLHPLAASSYKFSEGSPSFYSVLTTASSPSPPEELLTAGHGGFLGQNQNRHNRTGTGVFLPKPMVATVLVGEKVLRRKGELSVVLNRYKADRPFIHHWNRKQETRSEDFKVVVVEENSTTMCFSSTKTSRSPRHLPKS